MSESVVFSEKLHSHTLQNALVECPCIFGLLGYGWIILRRFRDSKYTTLSMGQTYVKDKSKHKENDRTPEPVR